MKHKPKNAPVPEWLKGGGAKPKAGARDPSDLSDLEAKAALTEEQKRRVSSKVDAMLPRARNPETGEEAIYKNGQWQVIRK